MTTSNLSCLAASTRPYATIPHPPSPSFQPSNRLSCYPLVAETPVMGTQMRKMSTSNLSWPAASARPTRLSPVPCAPSHHFDPIAVPIILFATITCGKSCHEDAHEEDNTFACLQNVSVNSFFVIILKCFGWLTCLVWSWCTWNALKCFNYLRCLVQSHSKCTKSILLAWNVLVTWWQIAKWLSYTKSKLSCIK